MAAIVWKGYVSFGLVSFPVRLYAAGRAESVHFHLLHKKDLSRVKEVWYCAEEDKAISRSDMVRGYEVSKGEYVVVEDEELDNMTAETASTMEVIQFVKQAEVDPIWFEHSFYVAPGEDVTKPYALFLKALEESEFDALAKVAMHGREHVVLIRAAEGGLLAHTLFYENELHAANREKIPAKAAASKKEVDLAMQLIRQLAGPFKPSEFHDTYRENVEKLIEMKQNGTPVAKKSKTHKAPVVDLMEALRKSLNAKAPAATTKRGRKSKAA